MKGSFIMIGNYNSRNQVVWWRLIVVCKSIFQQSAWVFVDEKGLLSIGTITTVCSEKEAIFFLL